MFCDVEPKRKALAAANAELAAAQEKLSKIKAKIKVCGFGSQHPYSTLNCSLIWDNPMAGLYTIQIHVF